jgi:hypothetical protein
MANTEKDSSTMVKKANFARNAAHWHVEGGSEYVPTYFNPIGEYPYIESMSNIIHFINQKTNRQIRRGETEDRDYEMWEQKKNTAKEVANDWNEKRLQNIYGLSNNKKWKKFVDSYVAEHGKPTHLTIDAFLEYAHNNFKDFGRLLYDKFPEDKYGDEEREYFLNWRDYYRKEDDEVAKRIYPSFEKLLNDNYGPLMTAYKSQVMRPSNAEAFTRSYFASEAYKNRLKKQGLDYEDFPLSSVSLDPKMYVGLSANGAFGISVGTKPMEETREDLVKYGVPTGTAHDLIDLDAYPSFVVAHELAHDNPLYNTRGHFDEVPEDSRYYGNDYTKIPQETKNILIGTGYKDEHDAELSENYSDLVGTRALLFDTGIFDSRDSNAVFNQEMLDAYKKTEEGKSDRFLQYHTDEQIIKAINDIAQNNSGFQKSNNTYLAALGGSLDKNAAHWHGDGGTLNYIQIMKNGSKVQHRFGKGTLKYGLGSFIKNIATKVNTVIPSVTPYTNAILRRLGLYDPHEGQSKHILNLTGKKMAVVTKDTPDVESVLGNEFIEKNNPNTVNTVSEFKKMPYNTVLGDGTMKLGDIRVFYGINPETQTFNIGSLDSLPNYLTVIPVRNKGAMLVDSIVPGSFIDDKTKKYLYKES